MSIKDLFDKNGPQQIISQKSISDLAKNVESSGNIAQTLEDRNRFVPVVNFDFPQNFARYGKAETYYRDSFRRVYEDYPYDGTLAERQKFKNESTYLDLYLLERKYPRTTGFATLALNGGAYTGTHASAFPLTTTDEYISIKGGPNAAPSEYSGSTLHQKFEHANVYDSTNNRTSNLSYDASIGSTVEFWCKKNGWSSGTGPSATTREVIYDLTGSTTGISRDTVYFISSSAGIRLRRAQARPGAITSISAITLNTTAIPSVGPLFELGKWNHFAITTQTSGSNTHYKWYMNGTYLGATTTSDLMTTGYFVSGTIGALNGNFGSAPRGAGKLSGSLDEFRYWKTGRTSEEIGKYWFTQVGGGSNTEDANVDLGVYYKFNEGITGIDAQDSIVLDYSGRISNGEWTGYSGTGSRSTGSAIDSYLNKVSEFKDPIIYADNPLVKSTLTQLAATGSNYDLTNNSCIFNSMPAWITEKDEENAGNLLKLTQIMGTYLDDLHLQIESLPRVKDKVYNDPSLIKPKTFASRLLETQGFLAPEIFADADVLAQIMSRDDSRKFELDLQDIKNTIYQNIYNNLIEIYKSKGSEAAFRNLIRCYGVDENLIRMNIYGNNVTHQIEEKVRNTTTKKKYADFNHPNRFAATIYQQAISGNVDSISYITASSNSEYLPFTLEADVIFPKKLTIDNSDYFYTSFTASSLFGFHGVTSPTDYTWPSLANDNNIQVFAVREELESENVYFQMTNRAGTINVTSSLYYGVYDNQQWNFALRYKPAKSGVDLVPSSTDTSMVLELYGVSTDAGIVNNEFTLSTSITSSIGTAPKRIYAGAHRDNFTGSTLESTDIKLGSVKFWASYLENPIIKRHAIDPDNYGSASPDQSSYLYLTSLDGVHVPQTETLALNWGFNTITSSDPGVSGVPTISDAGYNVPDLSSGSLSEVTRYRWLGSLLGRQHTARGDFYLPSDPKAVDTKFIYSGKQVGPEVIQSSDAISIVGETDLYFNRDTRPTNFFYSLEKSMYQTISDEMLNIFGTIAAFNNLIGDPVNRYRAEYKSMAKLRQLFFENVENTPDLDKYIDFYKWIDTSLNTMLAQLVPMSADVSDGVRTLVESHILERNKYKNKFPTLEFEPTDPEAGLYGINRMLYNWREGHHPVNNSQQSNCYWWKARASRETPPLSSGTPSIDRDRQAIFNVTAQALNRSYSTPYRFGVTRRKSIKGGVNNPNNSKPNLALSRTSTGTQNGLVISNGGYDSGPVCNDPSPSTSLQEDFRQWATFDLDTSSTVDDPYDASLATGLQAYYRCDGTADQLTNHSGTYANGAATVGGYYGKAWGLSGSNNSEVLVTPDITLRGNLGYTLAAWVYSFGRNNTTNGGFTSKGFDSTVMYTQPAGIGVRVGIRNSGGAVLWLNGTASGTEYQLDTSDSSISGSWNHVTWRTSNGTASFFLNSVLQATASNAALLTLHPTQDTIGNIASGFFGRKSLANKMDDVGIWTRDLSDSEVSKVYSREINCYITHECAVTTKTGKIYQTKANSVSPFKIYKNNGTLGGYEKSLALTGVSFNNYHQDVYGDDLERPLQGPFTEANVGGLQYRHNSLKISLNPSSTARREGFRFTVGAQSSSFNPQLASRPQGRLFRNEVAKRPVNIANIKSDYGNYQKDYNIVQTSGRYTNNQAWVSGSGWDLFPPGKQTRFITSSLNFPKIQRGRTEHVFVNRFSSPGGKYTMGDSNGGLYLDRFSAEFSPYNDLNVRNYDVRHLENQLLTCHANQFGYFSDAQNIPGRTASFVNALNYDGVGSPSKTNRNPVRRMVLKGTAENTSITSSLYDNYWVQHAIPQSDRQYSWITASLKNYDPSAFGYWDDNTFLYTTREKALFSDSFSSTLNMTNWQSQSIQMRESDTGDANWVARFGDLLGTSSVPRRLTTAADYSLPLRLDFSYSRGAFQNVTSRMYTEFYRLGYLYSATPSAVSASTGVSSISLWVNSDWTTSVNQTLFTFRNASTSLKRLHWDNSNNWFEYRREYSLDPKVLYLKDWGSGLGISNTWLHMCIVDDEKDPTYEPQFYLNGELMNGKLRPSGAAATTFAAGGGTATTYGADTGPFIIGANSPAGAIGLSGSMDSISWFGNSALSQAQVTELYNAGTPGPVQNLTFFDGAAVTGSGGRHYWQMGDAFNDDMILGTPATSPSVWDHGTLNNSLGDFRLQLYAYATRLNFKEYTPGFHLDAPEMSEEDYLYVCTSRDSGVTWQTASVLSTETQGKFLSDTMMIRPTGSGDPTGQSVRVRFEQNHFVNSKYDNWSLNSISLTRVFDTNVVGWSLESDYVSRINKTSLESKFGNTQKFLSGSSAYEKLFPTVYSGLNYNIYEPINTRTQLVGYGPEATSDRYLNSATITNGFTSGGRAHILNALLLKRNGPYGYPTWKQIRASETSYSRDQRYNNRYTPVPTPGPSVTMNGQTFLERFGASASFIEPAVVSNFGDVQFQLGLRIPSNDTRTQPIERDVSIRTSYGNEIDYFINPRMNTLANIDREGTISEHRAYDTIKDLYLNGALNDPNTPARKFINLRYTERVYPAAANSYLAANRERPNYIETFWRKSRKNRNTLGSTLKFGGENSQGNAFKQSAWALDSRTTASAGAPKASQASDVSYRNGELMNPYTLAHKGNMSASPDLAALKPAPMHMRRNGNISLYGVVSPNGMANLNTWITSSTYVPTAFELGTDPPTVGFPGFAPLGRINGKTGATQWQSNALAGTIQAKQWVPQTIDPFYDNYKDYNQLPKLKNKEYSIIPEFRISENMEYYFNEQGGDFRVPNPDLFTIPGCATLKSSAQDFYQVYSYSDFTRYFKIIENDHKNLGELEKTLTITCDAITKFLPYDGFFPAERTLNIATEFSRSYSAYITGSGTGGTTLFSSTAEYERVRTRPILQPFMAPGILYNTIKSGVAVDYPIHTSSYEVTKYKMYSDTSTNYMPTDYYAIGPRLDPSSLARISRSGWDYRVPFEAILNPEIINGVPFMDMEPSPQYTLGHSYDAGDELRYVSQDLLTSKMIAPITDNLYKLMVSNFMAETVSFFLKSGKLSSFESAVSDSGFNFESGSYGMRIKMRRSMNEDRDFPTAWQLPVDWYQQDTLHETMTMYSKPNAFGPAVAGSDVIYQLTGADITSDPRRARQQNSDSLFGRNPGFTPPYYDGECWYDIMLNIPTASTLTVDRIFLEATVKEQRIPNNATMWPSFTPISGSSTDYPYHRSNVDEFSMRLSSCLNVYGKQFALSETSETGRSPRWVIQTKMETPVMNFGDQTLRPLGWNNIALDGSTTGITANPIGMWHQFGLIPRNDEGIHLSIEDVPTDFLNKTTLSSFYKNGPNTKSLIDVVGFTKNDSRKMGQLRSSKTVSEAVVAVPFLIKDGERRFFKISRSLIKGAQKSLGKDVKSRANPGQSVIEMVAAMDKFVFPPEMDFNLYEDIEPFAMYIFEFSHTFSQDDLSYIWQNLTPPSGRSFSQATTSVSHPLVRRELLSRNRDKVQWMVFKVKQRANNNYYSKLQFASDISKEQRAYSYNWPYDFFSLVEFGKTKNDMLLAPPQPVETEQPLPPDTDAQRAETSEETTEEKRQSRRNRRSGQRSKGQNQTLKVQNLKLDVDAKSAPNAILNMGSADDITDVVDTDGIDSTDPGNKG